MGHADLVNRGCGFAQQPLWIQLQPHGIQPRQPGIGHLCGCFMGGQDFLQFVRVHRYPFVLYECQSLGLGQQPLNLFPGQRLSVQHQSGLKGQDRVHAHQGRLLGAELQVE